MEIPGKADAKVKRERIIKRTAKEFKNGMYANLGIGYVKFILILLT